MSHQNLPLVLFDFGGTLNSDGDHWGALFRQMLLREFPEHDTDRLERAYIASERRLARDGLSEEGFDETLRRQIVYQFEDLDASDRVADAERLASEFYRMTVERMAEVRELFSELSGRAQLGIVSNFYGNIPVVVEEFQLGSYLSVVIDSALVGLRKPDVAIWKHAIGLAGGRPETTVIVGDSFKNDIRPGAELGCATIWYRGMEWRPVDGEGLETAQVSNLSELGTVLDTILTGMIVTPS